MRVGNARHSLAAAVVCLLTAVGCNCGQVRLREITKPALVQGIGGLSCNGEAVRLTSLITGGRPPFQYQWSPADGLSDATAESPMATVAGARTYTLTVTDSRGQVSTATAHVDSRHPPTINLAFAQGGAEVCGGAQVLLDASGSRDSAGAPVRGFFWELGSAPTPGPSSATSGLFTPTDGQVVKLKVVDEVGCEATAEQSIAVRALPQVDAWFEQGGDEICAGDAIQLGGEAFDANGDLVETLEWDLDGNPATIEATGDLTQAFQPAAAQVQLIATDVKGCRGVYTQPLTVFALPKPALRYIAGAPDACEGTNVTLDASASTDADGGPVVRYAWDVDGDATTIESADAISPPITALGTKPVTVTVFSDKGCAATIGETITARGLPRAAITFDRGRMNMCQGDSVALSAAASADVDGLPVSSVAWDFDNDGQLDATSAITPAITPTQPQTAKLIVTDAKGCQSFATQLLDPRALPTAKLAFVQGSNDICAGDAVRLDAAASTDADGRPVSTIAWDLDGNANTTEANGTDSGTFNPDGKPVRVTVADGLGCRAVTQLNVAITQLPTAKIQFSQGAAAVCDGTSVAVDASASVDSSGQPVARVEWDLDGDKTTVESTSVTPPAFTATATKPLQLKVYDAKGCASVATQTVTARTLPTAQITFAEGRSNVCLGGSVKLSGATSVDTNGNPVASYGWDLDGDGTVDQTTAQTNSFIPATARTTHLTVTDSFGCRSQTTQSVAPRALPAVSLSFTQGAQALCSGDTVALDAQATDADGQALNSFTWDLDGDASTAESVQASSGTYKPSGLPATVRVVDALGCVATKTQAFDIGALPKPMIRFAQGAALVCQGDTVKLDGSISTDAAGNPVSSFEWDFDGNAQSVESTQAQPSLVPPGAMSARLRVKDARGCAAETSTSLATRALPQARIAFAEGRANVCLGGSVKLSGSASTDADGQPVATYGWDLNGDGTVDQNSAITSSITPASNQTARLVVTDSMGCHSELTQAITPRALPSISVSFAQGADAICAGDSVNIDAEATDADGNDLTAFAWDLDGNAATTESTSAASGAFKPVGNPVSVRVVDALGCVATKTQAFDIGALPTPMIRFTQGATLVCQGDSVRLDGSTSTDAAGNPISSFKWDFDGNAQTVESTQAQPAAFAPPGAMPVRLRVTDARGCSAETSTSLATRALPQARIAFAEGRANVCLGGSVKLSGSASTDADGQPVATYGWDLNGDGTADQSNAVTSSITPASNQTARLVVTDSFGCHSELAQAITPRALPTLSMSFTQGADAICAGDTVNIDADATDADGNDLTAFAWDLDGNAATTESNSTTSGAFKPAGNPVTVRVVDALGCAATKTQAFDIGALPKPMIRFAQGAALVCQGDTVKLDGSISTDAIGNPITSFEWDLDGNAQTVESTQAQPSLVPAGAMSARLRVKDARGCAAETSTSLATRALPQARIAFAEGRANVCLGGSVKLSGSASTDADGQPVTTYGWDLNGDGTVDQNSAITSSITPASNQTARLVVTDSMGCHSELTQAITPRALPTISVSFTQGADAICAGDSVNIAAEATDADGDDLTAFAWDLDGNAATTESTSATSGAFNPVGNPATVRVVDALGCVATKTQAFDVGALPKPMIRFTQGATLVCQGDSVRLDGSTSTDAVGNPISSFKWDFDGNAQTVESTQAQPAAFAPPGAMPVRLRVTDARGCSAETSTSLATRALPQPRIAFAEGRANVCLGGSVKLSGSASTDADGQPVVTYGWDLNGDGTADQSNAVTSSITPASNQTARLVVTDSFGCHSELTQAITPRALPTPVLQFATGGSAICSGEQVALDGSQSIDADGNPVSTIAWDLDGNASTTEATGANTGLFQPGPAPVRLSVVDALGCQSATAQTITTHIRPTARIAYATGSNDICEGLAVGLDASTSTDATGNQVTNFAWDLDGDPLTIESTQAQPSTLTATTSRPIHLTVTDGNGCTSEAFDLLTVKPMPIPRVTFAQGRQNACLGDSVALSGTTSTDAAGRPITSFEWDFDGNTSTVESSSANPPSMSLTSPRQVQLKVIDSTGCTNVVTQSLAPRGLPSARITFASGRSNVCLGDAVSLSGANSTDADGNPVQSYYWQSTDLNAVMDPSVPVTPAFTPAQGQSAQLIVVDAQGCQSTTTQALAPRALPTPLLRFAQGSAGVCSGDKVSLDAGDSHDADGNPVAQYAWDLDGNAATVEGSGISSGLFQPPVTPVQLAVTDVLGCRSTRAQEITTHQRPTARITYTAGSNDVCSGNSIGLDASASTDAAGGAVASYAWDLDGNASTIESNQVRPAALWPTSSQDVRLTVVDGNGCSSEAYDFVTVLPLPTPTIRFTQGSSAVCSGATVSVDGLTSVDGFGQPVARYEWDFDNNASTIESTSGAPASFVANTARPMTLRVFDNNGCTAATSQTVTARSLPVANIGFAQGRSNVCLGGAVALTGATSVDADGAPVTTYAWDLDSNGSVDQSTQITSAFTPSTAQTTKLTVTDSKGCVSSTTQAIAPRALPTVNVGFSQGRSNVCLGGAVALTGATSVDADGAPVASYAWDLDSNGTTDQSSPVTSAFTPSTAQTAKLTVTDALGCVSSKTQAIAPRALPTAAIGFSQGRSNVCQGGAVALTGVTSVDVDGAPVSTYAWDLDSNGTTDQSTVVTSAFTPSTAQTAKLTVVDSLGCMSSTTQAIAPRALPTANIGFAQGRSNVCLGGAVALTGATSVDADGASVASYAWDLDSNGTTDQSTPVTSAFTPSTAQTAKLTVTDALGCVSAKTQAIAPRALPTANIAFTEGSSLVCNGQGVRFSGTGSRDADNNAVASYAWDLDSNGSVDETGNTTSRLTPSSNRTVSLAVTDALGCTSSATKPVAVRALPTPRITVASGTTTMCAGTGLSLSGSTTTDTNGQPVTSYEWDLDSNGSVDSTTATTSVFTPGGNATASLKVTDSLGCTATTTQPLTVNPLPTAVPGAGGSMCSGGSVRLGGTAVAGLTYLWSPATGLDSATSSSPLAMPTSNTSYSLTVTNQFGCKATGTSAVTVFTKPVADAGPDRQVAANGSVLLLGSASSGTPSYSYAWTPASSLNNATIAQPRATTTTNATYNLTVTDTNGCQGTDSVLVQVQPALSVTASPNRNLCTNSGLSLPLVATPTSGVAPLTYAWTASPTCTGCITSPTSASTNVRPSTTTTFTVTVTDANGTQASAQTLVTVQPSITVNAGTNRNFTAGQTLPIGAAAQSGLTYSWVCNKSSCGLSSTTAANPNASPTATTQYTVTATDGLTCTASANVTLSLDLCATNNGGCDSDATCQNTGSDTRTCTCNPGFAGDGLTCNAGYHAISAGNTHSCGIRGDGSLWCWGTNGNGEIGDGTTTARATGVRVGTATDWTAVSGGGQFTCGIRSGQMWCWGRNSDSEVGDGTSTDRHTPTRIGTATNWAAISAGDDHTCALQSDGTLWCWGETSFGQQGIGSTSTPKSTPFKVSTATWSTVSSGHNYTCAIKTDGTLWCTGENGDYQQGTGSNSSTNTWTKIGTANTWASVDSGDLHTCAIRTNGTLWCWGDNDYGQVGTGSTTTQKTPVQIGTVTTWASVATAGDQGGEHTCATRTDKSLWCWGRNNSSQLGDGTTTTRTSPVRIGTASWLQVDTGIAHTCGLKADLTATCWGASSTGQPAP